MSKKQKRQVSRSAAPVVKEHIPSEGRLTPAVPSPAAASRYPVSTNRLSAAAEFDPDYSHVKQDLKRIGYLAGSFIVVLVALSFFLR